MIFVGPNGSYPRYVGDLLLEFPDWTTRKKVPAGWERVFETSPPALSNGTALKELFPARLEDGKLYQQWSLVPVEEDQFDITSVFPKSRL
jgi:hypothetical protein